MDSILNSLKSLFTTYGFRAAAIIVATVAVVNLIKIPIIKAAERKQTQTGVDKSTITKFITLLPIAVSFVLELIIELIVHRFAITEVGYSQLFSNAILYGALSVATYEGVKKQLEAYAAKKNGGTIKETDGGSEKSAVSASTIAFHSND